jgi:hypothetical protein
LAKGDEVLLDLEVPDEGRDRHERCLQARDREEPAPAEEGMLIGEAEHRITASLVVGLEVDAVLTDFERHGDRDLAVRGLHLDPCARELERDVFPF